jgi:hypothetical protein
MNIKSPCGETMWACNVLPQKQPNSRADNMLRKQIFLAQANLEGPKSSSFRTTTRPVLPLRVLSSLAFDPRVTRMLLAPLLGLFDAVRSAPIFSVLWPRMPPPLPGGLPRLLATILRTEPLPRMTSRIRLKPLFAANTLFAPTPFFHRASSAAAAARQPQAI